MSATITIPFLNNQERLREYARAFFRDEKNYNRLRVLMETDPRIMNILFFFVAKYGNTRLYNVNKVPRCLTEMYKSTLRSFRKHFFDFEAESGKGDFSLDGEINPSFPVHDTFGDLELNLPVLMAMRWFLANDLDIHFFADIDAIKTSYETYISERRERYSDRHKAKRRKIRKEVEQKVRSEQEMMVAEGVDLSALPPSTSVASTTTSTSSKRRRRKCYLTQEQRKLVNARIAEQIKQERQERKKNKRIKRSRSQKIKPSVEVAELFDGKIADL